MHSWYFLIFMKTEFRKIKENHLGKLRKTEFPNSGVRTEIVRD